MYQMYIHLVIFVNRLRLSSTSIKVANHLFPLKILLLNYYEKRTREVATNNLYVSIKIPVIEIRSVESFLVTRQLYRITSNSIVHSLRLFLDESTRANRSPILRFPSLCHYRTVRVYTRSRKKDTRFIDGNFRIDRLIGSLSQID